MGGLRRLGECRIGCGMRSRRVSSIRGTRRHARGTVEMNVNATVNHGIDRLDVVAQRTTVRSGVVAPSNLEVADMLSAR